MKCSSIASVALAAATVTTALPASSYTQLDRRATTCSPDATDTLIFKVSMATFQSARNSLNPSGCDWSSDNCSDSPDKPLGFNFIPSCQRHDFGYRNTKAQKRFTKAMKDQIDSNFKKDLFNYCATESGLKGTACRALADTYYEAVHEFGKRSEDEKRAAEELDDDTENYSVESDGQPIEDNEKREETTSDVEHPHRFELDPDIPGQQIPEVLENDGVDVDDLEKLFSEEQ